MAKSIQEIKTWPNGAIVDEVHLRITGVYEHKSDTGQYGPYTVQNVEAEDIAGEKIRIVLWDHPDATPLKGRDVVLTSRANKGKLAGVEVKHSSYVSKQTHQKVETVELKVTKQGTFQLLEVHRAQSHQAAPEKGLGGQKSAGEGQGSQTPTEARISQISRVHGATVGMAINLTCNDLTARGEHLDPDVIHKTASKLVRIAIRMENGDLPE